VPIFRDNLIPVIQTAISDASLRTSISEERAMSDWVVIYRTSPGTRETRSPSAPTERRALAHARALHMQGCEVIRINGPDNKTVSDTRIDNWIVNGRDRLDRAD
jgi:hypothetical protein